MLSGVGHLSPVVSIEPVLASADISSKSTLTADIEGNINHKFDIHCFKIIKSTTAQKSVMFLYEIIVIINYCSARMLY